MTDLLKVVSNRVELLAGDSGSMLVRTVENRVEKLAAAGGSPPLNVAATSIGARNVTISWPDVGASAYHVFRYDMTLSAMLYIGSTAGLTMDIPCIPENTYQMQVYSLVSSGFVEVTTLPSTTNPNTPYTIRSDNWSFTGSGAVGEQSFRSGILNIDDHPIIEVGSIIAGVATPAATPKNITYWESNTSGVVDSTVPTPADGGGTLPGDNQPTPTLAFSDMKVLPVGVPPGQILQVQVTTPSTGVAAETPMALQVGSIGAGLVHPEAAASGARDAYSAGDQAGVHYPNGVEIGIYQMPISLIVKLGPKSGVPASICNAAVVLDSVGGQQLPLGRPSKEGWVYQANKLLIADGSKIRLPNFSQGGARLSDSEHRARCVASYAELAGKIQVIWGAVFTANQEFPDVAAAQAAWANYLVWAAEVETLSGIVVIPALLTPSPGFFQSPGNLAAHAWVANEVDNLDGLRTDDVISNANMLEDGAHVNEAGQTLMAQAAFDRIPGILSRRGFEVV